MRICNAVILGFTNSRTNTDLNGFLKMFCTKNLNFAFQLLHFLSTLLLLLLLPSPTFAQRKLVCLDSKADVASNLWTSSAEIKGSTLAALPKAFGDLKGLGPPTSDLWYIEGPASNPSKDVTFKAPLNAYNFKARSVTLYMRYYSNSLRRLSLFPVKEGTGGSLQLLTTSPTMKNWIEVRKEIDPNESPIEITAHLGPKEFIIFDKILLAVDTPLPSNLSIPCSSMTLSSGNLPSPTGTGSLTPTGSGPRSVLLPPTPTGQNQNCPVAPECKCNCNCNCNTCGSPTPKC